MKKKKKKKKNAVQRDFDRRSTFNIGVTARFAAQTKTALSSTGDE